MSSPQAQADRPSERIGVLQVTDSLTLGGAERVAVNLANLLPRDRFEPHLCTTRQRDGGLETEIASDVQRLDLNRSSRLSEPRAVLQLIQYARKHRIRILHCHKDTIFVASLAAACLPDAIVIWHDHYGEHDFRARSVRLYRLANWRTHGVISVNDGLAAWTVNDLHFPEARVWYVPNFVLEHRECELASPLPGQDGQRIVCVANVRLQKDQFNLVEAMKSVTRDFPDAHLLMVGEEVGDYAIEVHQRIAAAGLGGNISILGPRADVPAILAACDIGVLSSESEGLPLSLIEYGMASLPAVSTRVGQCPDVLADGAAGLLVPSREPEALARGIKHLLESEERRAKLAKIFRRHVESHYGPKVGLRKITEVYDALLSG